MPVTYSVDQPTVDGLEARRVQRGLATPSEALRDLVASTGPGTSTSAGPPAVPVADVESISSAVEQAIEHLGSTRRGGGALLDDADAVSAAIRATGYALRTARRRIARVLDRAAP